MNILKKLTKKDLKLNKKRTIGTLIGIILSAALITVVLSMGIILRNTLIESAIKQTGYYHIQLSDIPIEDVELLKVNRDYSHMEVVKDLGSGVIYTSKDYLYDTNHVYSMDKKSFKYLKNEVFEGSYPTNDTEILVPRRYLEDLKLKIGDKINLELGKLVNTEKEITNRGDTHFVKKVVDGKKYEFTIVGTIEEDSILITTNAESIYNDVYLTLKKPKNYKTDFKELLGCSTTTYCNDKYDYYVNQDILRWEVFAFSDATVSYIYGIIIIVISVILFTSVFSIRNSFAISTTEKSKMYGMLRSVGATKKQVKKMVLYEGFVLGFVGLFIGSLLGIIVSYLLTIIVNKLMIHGSVYNDGLYLYYKFSIVPILISYLVGIIMIYLSSIPSASKASKVSPIDIMKDDAKNVKLKVPKFINKIFKIGGTLSYKNLKRSKKKYRVTVISLTVSIFVFITVSSFVLYGIKQLHDDYGDTNYDLGVSHNNYFEDIDLNKLKSLDDSYFLYYEDNGGYYLPYTSHIKNEKMLSDICDSINEKYECIGKTEKGVYLIVAIYDDDSFRKITNEIKVNYNKVKDKAIIINDILREIPNSSKKELVKTTDYKIGDTIVLRNPYTQKELSYEIGALTSYNPPGASGFTVIVNKEYLKIEDLKLIDIYYKSKDTDKLEKELRNISNKFHINNVAADESGLRNLILVMSIFIYGFIIVVTLIGLTSVFNTITSNMELRQKDFAILKSIGMTKKEFNNMILLEALFYSFKSLFYGTILGIIGSYFVYKVFAEQIDYGYMFPFTPILISIVFILFVVVVIMKYSINKINKQNIIETIRQNNI